MQIAPWVNQQRQWLRQQKGKGKGRCAGKWFVSVLECFCSFKNALTGLRKVERRGGAPLPSCCVPEYFCPGDVCASFSCVLGPHRGRWQMGSSGGRGKRMRPHIFCKFQLPRILHPLGRKGSQRVEDEMHNPMQGLLLPAVSLAGMQTAF